MYETLSDRPIGQVLIDRRDNSIFIAEEPYEHRPNDYRLATKLDIQYQIKAAELAMKHQIEKIKALSEFLPKAKDFVKGKDMCPECWASEVPGRHYNDGDTNAQWVNCDTCSHL